VSCDAGFNERPVEVAGRSLTHLQLSAFPSCRVSKAQTLQVEVLKNLIGTMSRLPTPREIILVSSGFYVGHGPAKAEMDLIDTAVRSNLVIHAVDVGNEPESNGPLGAPLEMQANSVVLEELAHGTGGAFEKRKDFAAIFRRLATPESHYVLGFIPTGTSDGRFHQLRIKVEKSGKLKVEARNGYFAP
jgi:VWFA-related protein